ncbi:response regulator [Herminiimonas fonticola]|uniref:Response regulator receiver domain-containing protein n=1 Tax=Herminiimonas fonticola TaxID=303380 RepID=A0A4R6GJ60_9BURK|nr:Response regulator receiver domain [Herminiimonas fonticola]TDN94470.1 response regulator receiver domain-containing protein [Herminiimonas fonticola]
MSFDTVINSSECDSDMNEAKNTAGNGTFPPLRIFLIEDSIDVRDLMIENLAMIPGVVVAGVSESEADALHQLNTLDIDILIVDIQLKKGNGINLLRQILGKQDYDPLKIICSNNATEVFRRVGRQYGVHHFFDKTSEFPQLFELVKELGHTHIGCLSRG